MLTEDVLIESEFITKAIQVAMIGMNSSLMIQVENLKGSSLVETLQEESNLKGLFSFLVRVILVCTHGFSPYTFSLAFRTISSHFPQFQGHVD